MLVPWKPNSEKIKMTKQVLVGEIPSESWKRFFSESHRDYDNSFTPTLVDRYNSFSGKYLIEDSRLRKVEYSFNGLRTMSNFFVRLDLPKSWGDFEMCCSEEMVHVTASRGGENREGILRRAGEEYVLEGIELNKTVEERK